VNPELTPPPSPTFTQITPQVLSEERDTRDTERSEPSEYQENLRDALKRAYEEIDKPKLERIQDLETSDFQAAETICRELIRLEEIRAGMGPGVTDDTTILHRKHKLAELLLSQKKYHEAEDVARDVWKSWESLRGETSKYTRPSLLLLCRALRGPKPVESYPERYGEAEETHQGIWWFSTGESDKYWRVQNGYEFALAVAEKKRYREAVMFHSEVMNVERAIADLQPEERSAILDSRQRLGETLCGIRT
jgi:hypothetical protein